MTKIKHIMIVAGETSGDIHAAYLVREIKKIQPDIKFSGLGGWHLAAEGVELYADLASLAVIGFVEVIKNLAKIKRLFDQFLEKADDLRPDAVILVDYPGFNLRMAEQLKKRNIKVIYYVSPQVWAWKEKRVKLIKRVTDLMLVFFDFEKTFYEERGLTVDFVGHPLIDHIKVTTGRQDLLESKGLNPSAPVIGLLPGSRIKEVETLLPVMIAAARSIHQRIPSAQFVITKSHNIAPGLINACVHDLRFPVAVIDNEFHNTINSCDICIVASGTATLETALLEKPMVIIYKTNWLTYLIGRIFIKIKWIGLVNIVARKKIVPECIQGEASGKNIADKLIEIYNDPFRMETTINDLKDVRKKLGDSGASRRAAEKITSFLTTS
ncbi:MAG: lipid-A-disaccharide synthase [Candidatus Omnitrophota bacterium]